MWTFRLDRESDWHPLRLPSSWEENGLSPDEPGPVWFRTSLPLPEITPEKRIWLRFHAVSYHCQIFVNGTLAGEHTGAWDPFSIEITAAISSSPDPHGVADILVRVTKPASLTAGPASPHAPGEFPLQETLSGFLPYVWGHAFGGIWQPVELYTTGDIYIQDASIRGDTDGRLHLYATLSHPASLHLEVLAPSGTLLLSTTFPTSSTIENSQFTIDHVSPWSPASPTLYTAHLTLENGDEKPLHFGFRTLSVAQSTLLLNHHPLYPRFVLSWGWYPDRMCPDPGPERVRADFARLKALGYNGVKLCLWFPPQYVFALADEMGFLLWVEFPLWMPQVTPYFRTQTPREIESLTRLARQHPSVILYTLGCELGPDMDPAFLQTLYHTVKTLIGDALLTGNSGSGEAYGGPLDETADFYDHHFYADPPFLPSLLDTFSPQWRTPKPWLMGEFCDFDTLRNWPSLRASALPASPQLGWLSNTSQGARWAMEVYTQESRLKMLGLWEQTDALYQLSIEKALLHRKMTLETVRARPDISGYVVTGEADTPISTAGMWDDLGRDKFDPEPFCRFNGEVLPLLGFRRWREWVAGGDRPVYGDRFCVWGGEEVRVSLLVSHFGRGRGRAKVSWQVALTDETPFARGDTEADEVLSPGQVREVGVARFRAPSVARPTQGKLRVVIDVRDGEEAERGENEWAFWFFPREVWAGIRPFALVDPGGRLADLREKEGDLCREGLEEGRVGVFTMWTPVAVQFVAQGGRAVVLQGREPGPLPVVPRPFWRECIQIGMPHPAWGQFPFLFGGQYYALGTDLALATTPSSTTPLLRRLDTRQVVMEDYVVDMDIGRGRVILTTLRLDGGMRDQPSGITRSPAGMFLLAEWVRYLQEPLGFHFGFI